jgi:hypothetical protein
MRGSGALHIQLGGLDNFYPSLTNEWVRYEFKTTQAGFNSSIQIRGTGSAVDVELYGAQYERNDYASSYIPTYGSAVTRSADVCNSLTQAGNDRIINDYNTSIFIDLAEVISNGGVIRFVTLFSASGGSNPRILLYANSSQVILQYRVTGQSDLYINQTYNRANQNKVLFRLNDNKLALFHNGSKVSEITIVKGDDIEYLTLAESSASDSGYRLSNLLSFPTALTDSECIALTTL